MLGEVGYKDQTAEKYRKQVSPRLKGVKSAREAPARRGTAVFQLGSHSAPRPGGIFPLVRAETAENTHTRRPLRALELVNWGAGACTRLTDEHVGRDQHPLKPRPPNKSATLRST